MFLRERTAPDVAKQLLTAPAELLLDALPPLQPQTRFLEVSAAAGTLARPLMERIAGLGRLVAIEGDVVAARRLPSAKGRAAVAVAEPERLPFAAGSFDVIIGNLVLGDAVDDAVRVGEMRRVLRTGGWLLQTLLLRGSFDALLDVLTESCEAEGLHKSGLALLESRRAMPDEDSIAAALRDVDVDVVHVGIEERGLFFANGDACMRDPLVREVLVPGWLGDAPPLTDAAWLAAARAVDSYFTGTAGRFALRLRTAIVTGRAVSPRSTSTAPK
jgi:SAM-dependent methyltransferase